VPRSLSTIPKMPRMYLQSFHDRFFQKKVYCDNVNTAWLWCRTKCTVKK